jgi:voltage-gated potassium channel
MDDRRRQGWDLAVALLAFGHSLILPLGFIWPLESSFVPFLSLLVSLVFCLDIVVELRTALPREGGWIEDPRFLFSHYLRHGMIPDILAVVPGLLFAQASFAEGVLPSVLVLLPLLKLFKVNRTLRALGENRMNPAIFRLAMLVFWILMAAHVIACGWIRVSGNPDNLQPLDRYITAFYWTTTTLTTIGYGDITPVGRNQTLYVILIELFGAAMYGLVIGNIAGLIANIDVAKAQYREKLDRINAFLKYRDIPEVLRKRIHAYYGYLWDTRKGYDELAFLKDLPVALKESVALHLNKEIIKRVPLFEKADQSLIRDIILQLEPVVFTPEDYIVRAGEMGTDMYFISRGEVSVLSADEAIQYAQLGSGQFFGEISLLLSMPRTATIRARTFCDLYRLDKRQFDRVIERYPAFKESIGELAERRRQEILAAAKPKA